MDPKPKGVFDYRTHFFAPGKYLFGQRISTFAFNLMVIWLMTLILYVTLYFELLRKLMESIEGASKNLNSIKAEKAKKN